MPSASTGGLTSVAPQENSTVTSMPFSLKYCSVTFTSSVAMVQPAKSCGVLKRESSGAASTHLTVPKLCLEYTSSWTGITSAREAINCSAIQS